MPTNELSTEKRIATELSIPESPPVVPEEVLNSPHLVEVGDEPPQTHLLLSGFEPDELTVEFLLAIHEAGDEHGLPVESISVRRDR